MPSTLVKGLMGFWSMVCGTWFRDPDASVLRPRSSGRVTAFGIIEAKSESSQSRYVPSSVMPTLLNISANLVRQNVNGFVKRRKFHIPSFRRKPGTKWSFSAIQSFQYVLDAGSSPAWRLGDFLRIHQNVNGLKNSRHFHMEFRPQTHLNGYLPELIRKNLKPVLCSITNFDCKGFFVNSSVIVTTGLVLAWPG